ncbi:hypothetical protein DJ69_12775 [Halorubrum persicum]|uniref:Uncharacterized protein n=1 Tax=Halorubrum persicum TaxID=1383844 RepID=A0A2G1WGV5_9EURY|nr:hypothetical protein [Halorubrum persicum]PHQ38222.1 hypothetical protein DJ69_12775 [Halorubrum persicum]
MAHPRLDTDQLSPDFDEDEDDSDDDGGLLDRADFDAPHWQIVRQLLSLTPTFTTFVVYAFLGLTAVTASAFLGFAVHPVFNVVAAMGFILMYPAAFLGFLVVAAVKAMQ